MFSEMLCKKEVGLGAHALPFLELTRSATSRLRARLGSKFWGSHALSVP